MNICLAAHATSQPKLTTSSGLDIEPHLVQDAFLKAATETQWMPSSATEAPKASERSEGPFLPDLRAIFQEEKPGELKDQSSKANNPPKKFSLLDIIGDDSKSGCQERSPMEVYAAFSLEGTGKIRDQTPNYFPQNEGKTSVFTRVDDLGFDLPAMPINASSQGAQSRFDWSTITLSKEHESKGKGYKFYREDIQMASMNFPENVTLNNKPHHNGVCKMASLRNNVNGIATDLDCSSSSTFNPHFTTNFGTENGDDIWDSFSIDETLSTSIGNNSWLHDIPVERNWSQFDNMPRRSADFVSLRAENYSGKDSINDGLEINGCRTLSPYSPNFHKQRLCEMQDDTILEQFDIDSSRAMSGDSQTSPYLEEVSVMLKKSDLSMMKSHSQTKMKVMNIMSELMIDKRGPVVSSSFNSRCSYDETFQSKFPTNLKPESEKSKSIVLGKMELAKEGNKRIYSPLYFLEREEKIKYLAIPQNEEQNNFIKNLDNRIKLNTVFSSKDVEKNFISVDQDECKDSKRMTSQGSEERSIDSKHKSCSLQIESSFTCVNGQEIIQPRVTQNHIDEVHHLELEEAQTKQKEAQKALVFHEYEHLTMCSKEQPDAKPERMEDCKTQGHSKEGYPYKRSQIDISSLPVMNRNKIEPQGKKSMMDDAVSLEYQAMLESYILQLCCMNKVLQQTMDEEIFNKKN